MRRPLSVLAFVAFTVFSVAVAAAEGPFGWLTLAPRGWGAQVLLDLAIALAVAWTWLVGDARARGINPWPYVAATLPLGSVAVLAYLVRREFGGAPARAA